MNGVLPASSGLPPAVNSVVPASSDFPPATKGVVPGESVQARTSSTAECLPGVEHGLVGVRSLVSPVLQTPDLGALTDIKLTDGFDDTPYTSFCPSTIDTTESQDLEAAHCHVPLGYKLAI